MLWHNAHARFRERLSPYVDGQLSPREKMTLEPHLAGCDACRGALDELRATVLAVGGLTDADPPRSFALTPRMLEQRVVAPAPTVPPLATGMRLAGAGIALVLAIVMVGDLGGVGGGNDRDEGGGIRQAAELSTSGATEYDAGGGAGGAPAPAATGPAEDSATIGADRAPPENLAASAGDADRCPSASDEARAAAAATPAAEAVPSAAGASGFIACAPAVQDVAPKAETPADVEPSSADEERDGAVPTAVDSGEDGGVSALTLIEIILAGGLVALVGAIGIEYMLRRRAV